MLIKSAHSCQLSRNIQDSPGFTSFVLCPHTEVATYLVCPGNKDDKTKSGFCIY